MTKHSDTSAPWRSRIVGHAEVPAKSITANPLNFRIHPDTQRAAVSDAVDQLGWIRDVLINRTTGHLLDGHLRVELAAAKGETVPVAYVELSDAEERLALAVIDPLSALAVEDSEQMAKLVDSLDLEDSALAIFLQSAADDAALTRLLGGDEESDDGHKPPRLPQNSPNICMVVPLKDLALAERAILATDNPNRGEALAEIFRSYLDGQAIR